MNMNRTEVQFDRFDIFFRAESGEEYHRSILAENSNAARNLVGDFYLGLRGIGEILRVGANGLDHIGEPIPFRVGKGEYDGDAA